MMEMASLKRLTPIDSASILLALLPAASRETDVGMVGKDMQSLEKKQLSEMQWQQQQMQQQIL